MAARSHVSLHAPSLSNSLCMPPAERRLRAEAPVWRTQAGLDRLFRHGTYADLTIFDMAEAFVSQVLIPLAVDAVLVAVDNDLSWHRLTDLLKLSSPTEPSLIATVLGRDRSLLRLIDLSDHWHKNQRAMDAAITCATDDRTWPALFAKRAVGDLLAVPLVSAAELATDGAQQEHCVSTYVAKCLYERTHIVSLQMPGGERIATLELAVDYCDGSPSVAIIQNRGHDNGDPGPGAAAAAAALVGGISSGTVMVDWVGVEAARAQREADRPASTSEIAMMIGYDPLDTVGRDVALAQWAFALPRNERGLSHARWAEQTGLPARLQRNLRQAGCEAAPAAQRLRQG
jgi:hypothetical protein